jgi:hypothetical protein
MTAVGYLPTTIAHVPYGNVPTCLPVGASAGPDPRDQRPASMGQGSNGSTPSAIANRIVRFAQLLRHRDLNLLLKIITDGLTIGFPKPWGSLIVEMAA